MNCADPFTPSTVAVIAVLPCAKAEMVPELEMVATVGLDEFHTRTRPMSAVPAASRMTAVACAPAPTATVAAESVTATVETGASPGGGGGVVVPVSPPPQAARRTAMMTNRDRRMETLQKGGGGKPTPKLEWGCDSDGRGR